MAHIETSSTGTVPTEQLTQEQIWDDSTLISTWDAALAEYKKFHSLAAKGENVDALLAEAEAEEEKARETARRIREGLAAAPEESAQGQQGPDSQEWEEGEDTVMEKAVEMGDAAAAAEIAAGREEGEIEEADEEDDGVKEEAPMGTGNPMLDRLRGAMAANETAVGAEPAETKTEAPVVEETNGARKEGETVVEDSTPAVPSVKIPDVPGAGASAQGMPVIGGSDENLRNLMMSWYWAGYYTGLQEGRSGR